MRTFAGLELGRDAIPDETTILNFRHLLERHDLTKAIFAAVAEHLAAKGEMLRGGTIVDATLIAASPSTKNEEKRRVFLYRSQGRRCEMGLGGLDSVSLARAHELAARCRLEWQMGAIPWKADGSAREDERRAPDNQRAKRRARRPSGRS